jgi:hypothetical protein
MRSYITFSFLMYFGSLNQLLVNRYVWKMKYDSSKYLHLTILHREVAITTYVANADELLASLVPEGQEVWMADNRIFTGSL